MFEFLLTFFKSICRFTSVHTRKKRIYKLSSQAMSDHVNYYKILGIRRGASSDEIVSAYRTLSMEWNPVKRGGDEAAGKMYRLIAEAFDVLNSPPFRAAYDLRGVRGLREENYQMSGTPDEIFAKVYGTSNPFAQVMFTSFEDKETQDRRNPLSVRTQEKVLLMDCTLEELYCGARKHVAVNRSLLGNSSQEDTIMVDVKKGSLHGDTFTYRTKGDHTAGKEPGDLTFKINELPHGSFVRHGLNLHYTAKITLADALGQLVLPLTTPDGRGLSVDFGEVIVPGAVRVIKGEGMPGKNIDEKSGDIVITFNVTFPKHLDMEQKKLIQNILNGRPGNAYSGKK